VIEVPIVPNSIEIWQAFRNAWSDSVIFGQESPDKALAAAASQINQLVTGNGEP
jgi:multiple sugar transport system substrate-binding protein